MAKCRVIKGGWFWCGVEQVVGTEIDATPEWIQNRVNDGLVVPVEDRPAIEQAVQPHVEVEIAVAPRQRKTRKAPVA